MVRTACTTADTGWWKQSQLCMAASCHILSHRLYSVITCNTTHQWILYTSKCL